MWSVFYLGSYYFFFFVFGCFVAVVSAFDESHLLPSVRKTSFLWKASSNNSLISGVITNKIRRTLMIIIDPNHLKIFTHKVNSNNAINHVLKLPSLIADRLLSYAVSIADLIDLPPISSSLTLSYIKTLASTPIPIERMIAAIALNDIA